MEKFDFSGWATRNDVRCSDGRTIKKDAFKHNDGQTVPLVWNHQHNESFNVLGHALLENREEGVYAYCKFNDTESGKNAKLLVEHGDVVALSIFANHLQQKATSSTDKDVLHGDIREVSLVLAGANPQAFIDVVMCHSADGSEIDEDGIIYTGESIALFHAEESEEVVEPKRDDISAESEDKEEEQTIEHAEKEESKVAEEVKKTENPEEGKTVKEVFDSMTEEQKTVVYAMIGAALEDDGADEDNSEEETDEKEKINHSEGGNETMKHNVFDQEEVRQDNVLTHADQEAIISMAKSRNCGTLQHAISAYAEDNETLSHGWAENDLKALFPDYKDLKSGAPELLERDYGWVGAVMKDTHKSPISRIRTRQVDARELTNTAKGYKKGAEKAKMGNLKLLSRTTDPQTVYIKDSMHRDDIIDITDFDVVEYQYGVMRRALEEKIAIAAMIGDGLEDGTADKIEEVHIRPIWTDDELYTIHRDVDIEGMKTKLQGSNTSANFGEEYIYAEAIIAAALYARENYKGSGSLKFFCTPHLLNVMLLARDLNGRRIYSSKADLAAALNVTEILTAEQFEGKTRTTKEGDEKKLLGIFVNLNDYQFGSTKGGEITRFNQFDIDFNQEKYLIETRLSGALTKVYSAIALEEPVIAG